MNKSGDVSRELSRPNKKHHHHHHHHHLLVSGENELRREKVKRLSVVDEMGCDGIEPTPEKFKVPRKAFGDSSSVHPASVPKKLRSAIKKRGCESVGGSLPDSKRLSRLVNSVEPLRNDCSKKSKLSMNGCSDHSTKQAVSVLISKDEEEVAETLFAMAGMIPFNDIQTKDKMDGEPPERKASDFVEKPKNPTPAHKDSMKPQVETGVTCCAASGIETNPTVTAGELLKESVQQKCSIEAAPLSWPNLSERRHINSNSTVSVPQLNLQTIPPLLRTCDQRSLDSTFFNNSTGPSWTSGLKEIKQEKVLLPYRGSLTKARVVDTRASDGEHVASVEKSDEVLLSGLTSKALHGSELGALPLQSSTIAFPSWHSTATSSSELVRHGDTISTDKLLRSTSSGGKSWKKCAAHVHITYLIQKLQTSEGKGTRPLDASHLRPSQCLSDRFVSQHSSTARDAINAMTTGSRICGSAAYTSACEASNATPVNHKLGEQEGHSKMQNFDFLSLSAGISSAAGNDINRTGKNLEPGAKSHILYVHSVAQHGSSLPFSIPQSWLPTISYGDKVSAITGPVSAPPQVHLQLPPYFGNHFGPTHMRSTAIAAHQSQRNVQQQQQHQIWKNQLAARLPGPLLSSHIANWQNRRQDLRSSTHQIQGLLPPPQPSLEVLGAKYTTSLNNSHNW